MGALGVLSAAPSTAWAIPDFARKYETGCSSCHTQTFPELNTNGRRFKENGFRRSAEEESRLAEGRRTDPDRARPMALLQDLPLGLRIQSSVEVPWSPEDSDRNTVDFHMFENVYVMSGSPLAERFSYFLSLSLIPSVTLHQGAIGAHDLLFGEDRLNLRAGRILLLDFLHPAHRSFTAITNPGAEVEVGLNPTRLDDAHVGFDAYGRLAPGRRLFYQMGVVQGAESEDGNADLDSNKDLFGLIQLTVKDPYAVGAFGYLGRTQITDRSRETVVRFTDEFWIAGGSAEGRWGPITMFGYMLRGEHDDALGTGLDTSYWAARGEAALPVSRAIAMLIRYDRVDSESVPTLEQEILTTHLSSALLPNIRLGLEWNSTWQDFEQSTVSLRLDLAL